MTGPLVRLVDDRDLPEIVAIYNDVIETSSTIWSEEPATLSERTGWLAEVVARGYPVFVASDASGVLGFVGSEPFRPWPGYAATCEHSIHVRHDVRSQGIGSRLLVTLEEALRERGAHAMVAGIDSDNDGSLRFHARAGFVEVGRMPEIGRMRGEWRDLVLVQKILTP